MTGVMAPPRWECGIWIGRGRYADVYKTAGGGRGKGQYALKVIKCRDFKVWHG